MSKTRKPEKVKKRSPEEALMIARGEAIEQYADLENVLCLLFGYLLGVKPNLSSIVFFRITNARARNSIIEKLMTEVIKKTIIEYTGTHS